MADTGDDLQYLRPVFARMNRTLMIPMWRLGMGRLLNAWPSVGGRILVLGHRGRRSGTHYLAPLNYAPVGDDLYVTAGFGPRTDWYRNVLADPDVTVWLPGGRWYAEVADVTDTPDRIELLRQVLIGSGVVAPMLGIHPTTMSDEELDAACPDYRVLRITPYAPIRGPEGRADLVWVWPVAAAAMLMTRRLRRSRARRRHSATSTAP
jgi:deazaflavin-dependent oxidoreductase (nitroreductase family)